MFERIISICPDLGWVVLQQEIILAVNHWWQWPPSVPGWSRLYLLFALNCLLLTICARPGNYFLPRHQSALIPIMAIKNTTDQKLNDNVLLTSKYSQRCVILWYQYSCASYPKSPSKNHCVIIICLRFNYTINLIRPELNCLFHGSLKVVFLFSLGRPQKHSWGDINPGCLDYGYESLNRIWKFMNE